MDYHEAEKTIERTKVVSLITTLVSVVTKFVNVVEYAKDKEFKDLVSWRWNPTLKARPPAEKDFRVGNGPNGTFYRNRWFALRIIPADCDGNGKWSFSSELVEIRKEATDG